MSVRLLKTALLSAALVLPTAAQARAEGPAGDVAERLADPATQIAVTAMLASLAKAMLDLEVGPLARSAGEATGDPDLRDIPPDARLRDLAGPDADRMEEKIARNTPRMMGSMAGMAEALDRMTPQLRAMARQMKDALPAR
jgi:hypothetical protein